MNDDLMDRLDPDALVKQFDRAGNQITLRDWATKSKDRDYKIVAQTDVGFWHVSTVWLGLDHRIGRGKPLFFETMVFRRADCELRDAGIGSGLTDHFCERYGSESAAIAGHAKVVENLTAGRLELYDT